jgi:hypothetical protein
LTSNSSDFGLGVDEPQGSAVFHRQHVGHRAQRRRIHFVALKEEAVPVCLFRVFEQPVVPSAQKLAEIVAPDGDRHAYRSSVAENMMTAIRAFGLVEDPELLAAQLEAAKLLEIESGRWHRDRN